MGGLATVDVLAKGAPRCPECGGEWVQRDMNWYANNRLVRDRCGFPVAWEHGVATATLTATCKTGHAFEVELREHADGWEVTGVHQRKKPPTLAQG